MRALRERNDMGLEEEEKRHYDRRLKKKERNKQLAKLRARVEELKAKLAAFSNIQLIESDVHKLEHPDTYGIGEIGLVNIDVDIYEPTVSALEFLTKCKWNNIFIRFDDWHGDEPNFYEHERLAFAEWIVKYQYDYQITHGGFIGGVIVTR
jgi:hypothetical protein